ncbi:MAG: GTPase [Lacipirellulaceae bacterium]
MSAALPTRAWVATPAGRGAIAVVVVSGAEATDAVGACFVRASGGSLADAAPERILYGRWGSDDGEEVIVVRCTFDVVEVHCHGGVAASSGVLRALAAQGVTPLVSPPADAWPGDSPLAREAWRLLAEAPTERVAAVALDQALGAMERALHTALAALGRSDSAAAIASLEPVAALRRLTLRPSGPTTIVRPWRVAICGPPNAGKSTLLNALAGYQRAIVADTPGTTRDALGAFTAVGGWPVVFYDTAGQRATDDPIEAAGVEVARETARSADVVLVLQELASHAEAGPRRFRDDVVASLPRSITVVEVASKGDLATAPQRAATGPGVTVVALPDGREGTDVAPVLDAVASAIGLSAPTLGAAAPLVAWHAEHIDAAIAALRAGDAPRTASLLQALLASEPRVGS